MMFNWQAVSSSQIDALAHGGTTLWVKFKRDVVRKCANDPPGTCADLLSSTSVGKAFGAMIKAFPDIHPSPSNEPGPSQVQAG